MEIGAIRCFIPIGGQAKRLRPLTYEIPKPLIPVQGITLTEHNILLLKHFGVKHITLSLGYMADKVVEYFKSRDMGVEIDYVIEREPLGTAGPLILMKKINKTFVMTNGDNLFAIDFRKMFEFHRKNNAMATIGLTRVDDPSHFGVARMSGDRIIEFVEKPKIEEAPSNLINSGYYILEPEIFDIVSGMKTAMMEKDVFPKIAASGRLYGFYDKGQWFDTGTFERWEKVIKEWRGLDNYK